MTRLVCATHGHCFDGLASAAFLTLLVSQDKSLTKVDYFACGYGPGAKAPPLDGDENALLDFRYTRNARLTYYIDHHATAFAEEADRADFFARAEESPRRYMWDPQATSCAGLLARSAQSAWGVDLSNKHADLITWADKIDGAQFASALDATSRNDPVMRLASVVERFGDSAFLGQAVPILTTEGLDALATARFVKSHYRSLAPLFRDYERRVREQGQKDGRVAVIDLSDKPVRVVSKFFHYREYHDAIYSVVVSNLGGGFKVSVGFNPWHGAPLDVNIGAICARYGGGGHAVVGAVAFAPSEAERAHEIAASIVRELQTPGGEG